MYSQLLTALGQRGERRCGGDAERGILQRALTVLRESQVPRAPEDPGRAGGKRKAEGGLAGVTRVGKVTEWIWPWSLQPARPPPGHTQQDCDGCYTGGSPSLVNVCGRINRCSLSPGSLPAPPRGLCSQGNQTLPGIGRALSAGEGSSGPPPTLGQFTTQSSNRATLGRDKQAGRGWHGRSHGVSGSGKSSRQPSAFKSSCRKGHMDEGSATVSAKRHMGDGSATVSSQLAGGRHSTASEEVST